jgi:hypothetical protein
LRRRSHRGAEGRRPGLALQDRLSLLERLAIQTDSSGNALLARNFRAKAKAPTHQADLIRNLLAQASTTTLSSVPDVAPDEALAEED